MSPVGGGTNPNRKIHLLAKGYGDYVKGTQSRVVYCGRVVWARYVVEKRNADRVTCKECLRVANRKGRERRDRVDKRSRRPDMEKKKVDGTGDGA